MNRQEIKSGLAQFTKNNLIEMFPSLELNCTEKKNVLIENIIDGEAKEEEIVKFKLALANKDESSPEPVYIVVHFINEDRKKYKPGEEYDGKFVERFLKGGQIRKKV